MARVKAVDGLSKRASGRDTKPGTEQICNYYTNKRLIDKEPTKTQPISEDGERLNKTGLHRGKAHSGIPLDSLKKTGVNNL